MLFPDGGAAGKAFCCLRRDWTDGIRGPTTDGFKWLDGTLILKSPGWQGAVDKPRDTRNRMGAFLSEKGQLITSHQGKGESRAGSQREVLSVPRAQTEH